MLLVIIAIIVIVHSRVGILVLDLRNLDLEVDIEPDLPFHHSIDRLSQYISSELSNRMSVLSKRHVHFVSAFVKVDVAHVAALYSVGLDHSYFIKVPSAAVLLLFGQFVNALGLVERLLLPSHQFVLDDVHLLRKDPPFQVVSLHFLVRHSVDKDVLLGTVAVDIQNGSVFILLMQFLNMVDFGTHVHHTHIGIAILSIQV